MTITSSSTSAFFGVLLISTFVLDVTKEATAQRIRSKKGPSLVPFSSSSSSSSSSSPYTRERKPNIVLILTDDQDVELGSMNFMPKTLRSMRDQGAQFRHAYVTTPMCCPSRSSLLTGMYVHNHNVYTNNDNCSSTTWQATHETRSFATYLSNAGYRTGYFGKYLNKYNGSYIPPGWREWGGLIMNSKYYNYSINMNGKKIKHGDDYHKDYYPDLIANDSIAFLRQSKKNNAHKPVMLTMSFPAPHGPEDSAPQYSHLFFNVTTHHTPSYDYAPNPDKQWILQITQKMRPIHKQFTDLLMTKRLQTLQSVDSAVQRVIDELDELGELDNTYVVYTSDHGYHLGQFGLIKGKSFPFEFDIRVPFLLRGPGIEAGTVVDDVVLNIDLAPTFLDMAGVEAPSHMDGHSILPLFNAKRKKIKWPDTFLIESSGRRETPFFDMRNKRMMTSVVNYSTSAPLFVSALDEFTTKGIKTTTPQSALRVFDSSENFNDDDDDLDDIDDLEGDDAETDIDEDNDSRTEGKDLLLPFESQFFEIGQSKSEKIAEECRQDGYQLPCKFAQKWYCQIEDGRWRKHKCKQNHYPLSQSGTSRSFKKCACFTTEGLIYKKIPVNVRKSKRSNRYKRDADLQEILFQKLGNRDLTLRQKRDTLTHVESVMERVQDKLLDLEAENSSLPARVHYSTRSNLATNRIPETPECFVSANGRVTCPKAIYEDKKTWRRSRHHIDNEIQHLKQKLEKLKEIRRHLKHSKPGPSDDVLASGEGVENRTDWSSFGDYGSTEQVTERGFVEVNGSGDGNRRRNNKNDGKRKKLDDEEFWNVSTEAPGGHHRHHHTQHRDYTTSTKGFLDVAVSTEAPRGGKRKKLPADVTVKTPKPKLEVTTERSVDTNLSNGEYCECEMEEPSAVPDPREAAREAKRRLKEERLRKKLRKQRKKAQLEKECSSESAIDSRMNCFHHDNDHWRTAPLWTAGPFCFCMNANNNTYSCVRTINSTHNFLYCEFVTGLATFYNLRIDPFELQNRIAQLKPEERSYLHDQLATLMACKGRSCSITHNTHTGGQRTRGVAHKVHSYVPQPQRYKRKRLMAEDPGNVARSLALLQPEVRPPPQHGQNSNLPSSLKQWKRRRSWGYPPNNREKQKKKQQFLNFDQYRGRWM